jgi:hypothetical protein
LASAGFLIFCSTTAGSCNTECVTFRTAGKFILSVYLRKQSNTTNGCVVLFLCYIDNLWNTMGCVPLINLYTIYSIPAYTTTLHVRVTPPQSQVFRKMLTFMLARFLWHIVVACLVFYN